MGFLHLGELPIASDLLVVSGDENGIFKKSIHEVRTSSEIDSGVTRLTSVRRFSFDVDTDGRRC